MDINTYNLELTKTIHAETRTPEKIYHSYGAHYQLILFGLQRRLHIYQTLRLKKAYQQHKKAISRDSWNHCRNCGCSSGLEKKTTKKQHCYQKELSTCAARNYLV